MEHNLSVDVSLAGYRLEKVDEDENTIILKARNKGRLQFTVSNNLPLSTITMDYTDAEANKTSSFSVINILGIFSTVFEIDFQGCGGKEYDFSFSEYFIPGIASGGRSKGIVIIGDANC